MAKQNYLKLALVIVLTMAATSTVHAAAGLVSGSIGGSSFNSSMKVSCYFDSDGTANQTNGTNYGIACGHAQGDKVVAAKSGDAILYFKSTGAGQGAAGAAGILTNTDFATWTSM